MLGKERGTRQDNLNPVVGMWYSRELSLHKPLN